jgi:hypothetical protein
MAAWVTDEDIYSIARREVSDTSVVVAQEIISIFSGVDADVDLTDGVISSRNVRALQRAVVFQAIWLEAHPDALETMDVSGVSQDGLSAQYATESAHLLAPLAARCIRRLSWKLAPLRARSGRGRFGLIDVGDRDDAERDDQFDWSPMRRGGQMNPLQQRAGQVWR